MQVLVTTRTLSNKMGNKMAPKFSLSCCLLYIESLSFLPLHPLFHSRSKNLHSLFHSRSKNLHSLFHSRSKNLHS